MVRFIMVGDTGSGTEDQHKVAKAMLATIQKHKDMKAVCIVGDNIYEEGVTSVTDPQFQSKFEEPYADIDLPFYLCLGNHDYGNAHFSDGRYKNQIAYSKVSPKWNMPSRYYKQSLGPCDLFFLDTNLEYMDPSEISHQMKTMRHLYRNSKNPWKILCGHHTWRSTGGHGNAEDAFETFLQELCQACRFDMYVCGHDHCQNHSVVTLPNGHQMHNVVIGTGGKRYDEGPVLKENIHKVGDTDLHHASTRLGYTVVHANPQKLTISFHDENAKGTHTATLSKNLRKSKMKEKGNTQRKRTRRGAKKRMPKRTTRSKSEKQRKHMRSFRILKAGTGKTSQALQKLPFGEIECDQESLAKLYYIALLSVSCEDTKLSKYKKTLERMIDDKDEIKRYHDLLDPNSWFMKWVVGGAGHLLGVTLGIWIYSQVGDPEQDSSFKKGIAGGGALVGMTHQFFTDKVWPKFSGWVNREYQKHHKLTLSSSEIDTYLHEIYKEWLKLACKDREPSVDKSCGLPDLETEMLVV